MRNRHVGTSLLHPFILFAILFVLSACDTPPPVPKHGDTSTESIQETQPQEDRARIALVMKTLTNPFFIEMEKGARKAEQEFKIDLIVKTAAQETSIEQQIGIVDSLIRDRVDAVVIAPGDSVELIPVLKKAQDAGIIVVNIDNQLDPDFSLKSGLTDVPFISVDNETAAYRSAKYIADQITSPAKAALMEGIRSAKNAEMRKQGALKAFSENPNIQLVAMESANWKIDESQRLMSGWLQEHPDIALIFCANDMMAFGAINALLAADRHDVLVASFDALSEAKKAIRDGDLESTIDQLPAQQGYLGVHYAVRILNGETIPATTFINTVLVTKDNVDKI